METLSIKWKLSLLNGNRYILYINFCIYTSRNPCFSKVISRDIKSLDNVIYLNCDFDTIWGSIFRDLNYLFLVFLYTFRLTKRPSKHSTQPKTFRPSQKCNIVSLYISNRVQNNTFKVKSIYSISKIIP